jgi:small-conductance mechanosensitive channel
MNAINDTVKTRFDQHGIEIPFPKRDITIVVRHSQLTHKTQQSNFKPDN